MTGSAWPAQATDGLERGELADRARAPARCRRRRPGGESGARPCGRSGCPACRSSRRRARAGRTRGTGRSGRARGRAARSPRKPATSSPSVTVPGDRAPRRRPRPGAASRVERARVGLELGRGPSRRATRRSDSAAVALGGMAVDRRAERRRARRGGRRRRGRARPGGRRRAARRRPRSARAHRRDPGVEHGHAVARPRSGRRSSSCSGKPPRTTQTPSAIALGLGAVHRPRARACAGWPAWSAAPRRASRPAAASRAGGRSSPLSR